MNRAATWVTAGLVSVVVGCHADDPTTREADPDGGTSPSSVPTGVDSDGGTETGADTVTDTDTGTVDPTDAGPLSTPVLPILVEDGFYPRAVALADGTVMVSIVAPQPSGRLGGTILESLDGGVSFAVVGRIDDDVSLGGLCCATLYALPAPLGALPAGTLLWSASVGGDDFGAPMSIPVFSSIDQGRNWTFLSTVAIAGVPRSSGGLWEPEFTQLDDGSLVCHYSDETDPAHSQKLVARRSVDGLGWPELREIVAMDPQSARPGMPVVRRAPGGPFVLSFEVCGTDACASHLRFSSDGWDWGTPTDRGLRPATLDGRRFLHAPTLSFSAQPGVNGRFLLVGQVMVDAAGGVAAENGTVLLANTEGGYGNWYEIPAPVPVPDAYDNFCPNYSSTVLPLEDGRVALEVASKWEGNRCRSFFARGPLLGTGDTSGLTDGSSYVLTSLLSGFCVDVVDGSTAPGANIRQWDCNGLGAQHFTFAVQPDGSAQLVNVGSGSCLVAAGASVAAGANVEQQPCAGGTTWSVENVGLGQYRVRNAAADVCLDVAGGSPEMGANIQQWTCNDLAPQIWRFDL